MITGGDHLHGRPRDGPRCCRALAEVPTLACDLQRSRTVFCCVLVCSPRTQLVGSVADAGMHAMATLGSRSSSTRPRRADAADAALAALGRCVGAPLNNGPSFAQRTERVPRNVAHAVCLVLSKSLACAMLADGFGGVEYA